MAAIFADASVFSLKAQYQGMKTKEGYGKFGPEPLNQWTNAELEDLCPCTREDFIIFAEFSEVMGPIPLLTIPPDAEQRTGIDVNGFIMKIMSVDYQANPSQSVFCEDAQVLQTHVIPGVHAYVHYLTLHDPGARGFVRPLCIAYVSSDQHKLFCLYPRMRWNFLQISQLVKYNNKQWFKEELTNVLHLIKETQYRYLRCKKRVEDGAMLLEEEQQLLEQVNMDHLVQQTTDYTHMLHTLEPLLQAEAGTSDALIGQWRCGYAQAEKADLILKAVRFNSLPYMSTLDRNELRCVLALSPWGLAAAMWKLMVLLRNYHACRLQKKFTMYDQGEEQEENLAMDSVEEALEDLSYLQLISNLVHLAPGSSSYDSDTHLEDNGKNGYTTLDSLEYMDANIVTSGNEGSSSYHSVPDSLNEVLTTLTLIEKELPKCNENELESSSEDHSSNSSFLDISEDSNTNDSWSSQQLQENKLMCIWTCSNRGFQVLKFFQEYDRAAHHILYSLLIGRTIVLVGNEQCKTKVSQIITMLSLLVPAQEKIQLLRWHRGILVSSHISNYHLIGICVPERLSVHDMISPKDKNSATILDVTSKQLFGPAYSGKLLDTLESTLQHLPSDQTLMLILQTLALTLQEKLFLYRNLITLSSQTETNPSYDVLKDIGLAGCDAEIIKHMYKLF